MRMNERRPQGKEDRAWQGEEEEDGGRVSVERYVEEDTGRVRE